MSKVLRRLAWLLPCCAAIGFAGAAQAQVTISQVYGGGGNSGATLKSDFIELHNNGTSAVDLTGWSVQYASATGSSWQVTTLSGSIAPGAYYLVKEADGSGGTASLPTPDATGTIPMSGTAGKVALVNATTALSGACPTGNIDFVGFGGTANCAEGSAPTPAPSNTLAVLRAGGGCTDSNNNAADFATGTPTPRNSASSVNVCGGGGQPVLNIADVVQAEGNSGASDFTFVVTLSQPAGAGGVSFDIATADGTATAGSDYTGRSLTAQTIPAGSSTYIFTVSVQGDTSNEADETFFVNVTNVTGALAGDAQAVGTIVNDDVVLTPIHDIQGNGDSSPLVGQTVTTAGIVTARRNNGFFLQAPDAEADADPLTSEGVFVFINSTPPAAAAVGSRVQVRGTVVEYVPSADPTQPPLTEIGGSPVVTALSTGHALPTPVALTATFPDPDGAYNQLERLEGMRVTAAGLTVNTPTLGSVNETNATGSSNGVFHAVVTGQPRAYRKPGVQQPDPLPAGSGASVPRWNTNPQVIAVSSNALGAGTVNAASGCLIGSATGPLDYSFRRYTLYPEQALQMQCNGADQPKPALQATADDLSVAGFNMQRFFDDVNDPAIGEPVLTPTAYQNRLNKASLAIRNYLNAPDILAVQEVESLSVLQTVAARIGSDAVAAGQPDPHYTAYLQEGNDVGGIDVGFLVKGADVGGGVSRVEVIEVVQEGKSTTWVEPSGATSLLNDRPPLRLKAVVHFNDGRSYPLTVVVVHQRSLNGSEEDTADGVRVRAKRQKQAEFLANLLQTRQAADPGERVLVLGDFNAFEFNDGYADVMGTVTGLPSADDQTVVAGDGADLVNPDYDDLTFLHTPDQSYSYAFDGNVQSLDHVIANASLMNDGQLATVQIDHARINADFPEIARSDAGTPTRLSDHDPAVVLLRLKAQEFADLGVAANVVPGTVQPGQTATFGVTVNNAGPNAAAFPAVAFVFDRAVTPTVAAPAGWTCTAPQTTPSLTTVTCSRDSLAAGETPAFTLQVTPDASLAGSTLTLATSVASQTPDENTGNNNASAALVVEVPPSADLAVAIAGPATLPASAFSAQYAYTLRNDGQLAAAQPTLTISGNTVVTTSTVAAPAGWQCSKIANGGRSVRFVCSAASTLAAGASASFTLKTNVKPTPAGGQVVVQGTAATATNDGDPSNDSASFTSTVN
ncbi:lamin tail domain-containing protein [Luteimonas aquatica]|uniref:lamin tail domain-containing protein n=1 Tax=Luteimonas aquatica TaxID=450364 RepID=UPI001F57307D|nr:lamin tail domain-containing protein [Luteimonas aquatica]